MNSTVKPENDIAGTATQRPLLSRDFVLLVAGQGISLFGNVMLRFAMSMWVLDETGGSKFVYGGIITGGTNGKSKGCLKKYC